MEFVAARTTMEGVDVGFHSSNLHPKDGEGCKGKRGLDKLLTLEQVIAIAYKMEEKPNIIIKAGKNAKWYLKRCPKELIENKIKTQQWRSNVKHCTMHIIDWR